MTLPQALGTLQAGLTSYGISSGLGSKEIGLAPREDFKVAKVRLKDERSNTQY